MTAEERIEKTIDEYNQTVNDESKFGYSKKEISLFADMMNTHARQMAVDAKNEIQPKLWKIAEHIVSEKIRLDKVPESKDEYIKHKAMVEEGWFDYMDDILFPDEEPDTFTQSKGKQDAE